MRTVSIISLLTSLTICQSCTDILVTPGASQDGSAMIAYNADSPTLFGSLYHYAATSNNPPNQMKAIYDWDSGVYLGEIPEVTETYNVVGNSNEFGLVIGESTFGGVSTLAYQQTGAIMDYGSLIYVTLQRAKTAREAIHTMASLMDTYGYYSGGESFSIADHSGEVWMMEVMGRGDKYGKKGAVWVAQKIPNGMVTAHANHARITTFARDDPENCLYADDVVFVAVFYGLYPADADPLEFSFSDVYDPLDFVSARQGEARVWSIFSQIIDNPKQFAAEYQDYALGLDLTHRMPLYVEPRTKLSVTDVMWLMTSHYEGTKLDSSRDVGSGLFASPYRPRPLVWEFNGTKYHNERSVATPKTGWSFVAQIRPSMPTSLSALVWFACDDSSTAPRVPYYSSSTRISAAYSGKGSQDGIVTPILDFDMTKAFWVQNMVSNLAYSRWSDVYPELREDIENLQTKLVRLVEETDKKAAKLYRIGKADQAIDLVTQFSEETANGVHKYWFQVYGKLFARYRDYYTIVPKDGEPSCGCEAREPGLSDEVKERIVAATGDHYKVADGDAHPDLLVRGEDVSCARVVDRARQEKTKKPSLRTKTPRGDI